MTMKMKMMVNNLTVATRKLESACKAAGYEVPVPTEGKTQVTVNMAELPRPVLEALTAEDLTQAVLAMLGDPSDIEQTVVESPQALHKILSTLKNPSKPTVETRIAGRWYPVMVTEASFSNESHFGPASCSLRMSYQICDQNHQPGASFSAWDFKDGDGNRRSRSVGDLLAGENLRICRPAAFEAWKSREEKASSVRGGRGRVVDCVGTVLKHNPFLWSRSLDALALGSKERPRMLVIEPELELERSHGGGQQTHNLPFLRCFSMDLKSYVYVDVDDVQDHVFERLVVPGGIRGILDRIFDARMEDLFGDVTRGRHGGLVVLANGTQGVGKTLTAEVFAERNRRPLYVLEMGELGTNLADVEKNLQRIFARATRWNAVLLFDEADVFLAKRAEADLERSAIVGVFLRLLDRYEGLFFLTTNRSEAIDPAFASRVTIKIEYPALDAEARERVWRMMLGQAGYSVEDIDLARVCAAQIDGRKIRNQVRLLGLICGKRNPTTEDVLEVLKFVS